MSRPKRAARKRQLTELFVKKVKPEKGAFLVWDTKQHGLALQVQPTGARAWKAIYSFHGRPRWLHLGSAAAIGLSDARLLAAEAMLAVAKGKDPAAEKRAERGAGTFAELHERYLDHAKRKNKSWQQGERLVNRYALPRWAKLQASTITRADVKAMLARIEDAPILQNQVLAAVSAVFSWALREEILPANPCKLIARNKTTSRERILAESELPLFWMAFSEAGLQGCALKALLLLGQRPGEIAAWRREHIVDGWWELPGKPVPSLGWPGTKNGQSHRVWLPKPVHAIVDSDATTGFVFAGPRDRSIADLDGAMRDICKKLGVAEPVRPHDLRRTHGSTITALGFGRDAMNRIQNHKDGGVASIYDRYQYAEENKRVMEAVGARIVALAERGPQDSNVVQGHFGKILAGAI
jgi:integrase